MTDDDLFDHRDLMELIKLAAYLEGKAQRGLFPRARFHRYSATVERLVTFLVEEMTDTRLARDAAIYIECLNDTQTPPQSAKILTHPRFHKRKPR